MRPGEVRVFAVALEVASPEGNAIDVDGGSEDHVAAQGFDFLADGAAFALDEIGVPGGGHGDAGGKGGGEDLQGVLAALVMAELPYQDRTPMGPSAILMAGMPRRSMGLDSIQPEPASMEAFSSRVMRPRRSLTRSSTAVEGFL